MSLFLHLVSSPFELAVDAGQVLEVWHDPAGRRAETESWRGLPLPMVDLAQVLTGQAGQGPCVKLVLARGGDRIVLAADQVVGSVAAAEARLGPLPSLLRHGERLFEGVAVVAGQPLLRLRPDADFTQDFHQTGSRT
jgi:chemotaxis signal transduction protein